MTEVEQLQKLVQQLYDKMTCMCGSYMDHSAWEGHTPVSMYDYALDQANEEIRVLRELVWLYIDPMEVRPEHEALLASVIASQP